MKTIQLVTPQNVLIEHELGSVMLRMVAFCIDQIAIIIFLLFCLFGIEIFGLDGFYGEMFIYIFVLPVYLGYTLLFEWRNHGQTLGKMMLGLRVRRLDGNEIGFTEAATRWLLRIVDVFATVGSLAALLIGSTERSQRLGDILAGTIVIRQVAGNDIRLDNLLKISTLDSYVLNYPEVQKLREEDVVLIKQTLVRAAKYNNQAHKKAIQLLTQKIENLLEIKARERSPEAFLRTLIKDYIVLTR